MTAQIVFLTLFLGLTSGNHDIELRADPGIDSIRILLDRTEVARLKRAPWKATVDFGEDLVPRELVAVGYSGDAEVARAAQVINLPRAAAEMTIVVTYDSQHRPDGAELHWRHVMGVAVKQMSLELDGSALTLDAKHRGAFPAIDTSRPHVLAGEIEFEDGTVARRESVFGGMLPEMMPAELTATAVVRTRSREKPAEKCFASRGEVLRTAAIEKPRALVVVVRDPDPGEAVERLDRAARARPGNTTFTLQRALGFEKDTDIQMMWPVAHKYEIAGGAPIMLFDYSPLMPSVNVGMFWALTRTVSGGEPDAPRRYADSVAVAGITALEGSRRRAVILVLGDHDQQDKSDYAPAAVRRYLESIGVPLFVWSLSGKRFPGGWGTADNVSSYDGLRTSVEKVRGEIARQRIAWIDANAITALRIEAKEDCGYAPIAK